MGIESVFDHTHKIEVKRVDETDPQFGQDSPSYSGRTVTGTEEIEGSFNPTPEQQNRFRQVSEFEEGQATLFTKADLEPGDLVFVHHDDTGNNFSTFEVSEITNRYNFISKHSAEGRTEYVMDRKMEGP